MLGTAGMLVRRNRMRTCRGGRASRGCCFDMVDAKTLAFGELIEISTESPSTLLAVPSDTRDGGLDELNMVSAKLV